MSNDSIYPGFIIAPNERYLMKVTSHPLSPNYDSKQKPPEGHIEARDMFNRIYIIEAFNVEDRDSLLAQFDGWLKSNYNLPDFTLEWRGNKIYAVEK